MAITNHERAGKALDLLREGLTPFVEREIANAPNRTAVTNALEGRGSDRAHMDRPVSEWDAAALLRAMADLWNLIFSRTLGNAERALVSELREIRNRWAHQQAFSTDDAYRALDSVGRLLTAIAAPQATEVEKAKTELLRVKFEEDLRTAKRRTAGTAIESEAAAHLKPWREVVSPHPDVASGRYQQAEFAADLWQVHLREGSAEYRDPVEFYRRTFLTESLKRLLIGAVQRLSSGKGDPVVQLQTNFGGGKTHSMLALYHLLSDKPPSELQGVDEIVKESGVTRFPSVKRVVLVGNKISPGNPVTKPDGTVVRTLWGELAWQLGGKKAYAKIKADDERATSPGDRLRELFNEHGPCLVLIDEWVAYARQLHDQGDLPAGSFETQFTFAQALTEAAKAANRCLLVISLPASDTSGSPHAQADDSEVGGQRGREALDRLRNVVGRVESSWHPASAEEGFEIVRRRLFQPLVEKPQFVARDTVAREFYETYRTQPQEFPPDCREADYEKRIRAAYPIHPEIFDRLYADWSTLLKFQRTRGVLRLMAAVIHSLWEKDDRNPLILPANVPIDDPRVQFELTRYLSDNWTPVIEKDVDGPNSLPLRIDADVPNLGRYKAARRVARTIYLGSAPTATAAHRGLEDRRVKLGCVMPGEAPAVFGDALRRLAGAATYLYQDGSRYWYSTQPTVTKLAEDRAEQFKRNADAVTAELEKRVREDLKKVETGSESRRDPSKKVDFSRIHDLPHSGQDVVDATDARLVVLGSDHPYSKETGNEAEVFARSVLESCGSRPRLHRNTLVFLAVDKTRLTELEDAVRRYLAWESIVNEKEKLDLSHHQVKQAETQRAAADATVNARLPEAYQWLLVPCQATPQASVEWQVFRLTGADLLAVRASRKLRNDELLLTSFAPTRLRMELDRVPLWRGDSVSVRQLVEDFARYLYLPRLKTSEVLLEAIRAGLPLMTWERDSFAYADSYDDASTRFRGLRACQHVVVADENCDGLLVKPEVAKAQIEREEAERPSADGTKIGETTAPYTTKATGPAAGSRTVPLEPPRPKRFHGSIRLNPLKIGGEAGKVGEEIVAHLNGLVGAKVNVTLEIEAKIPDGAPEGVVRTVTENARTMKFTTQGFEDE